MTIQNNIGFDINIALKIPHHFLSHLPEAMKMKYIRLGLFHIPVEILRVISLLQVNRKTQLFIFLLNLRQCFYHYYEIIKLNLDCTLFSFLLNMPHICNTDCPFPHPPHLIGKLKLHHILFDSSWVNIRFTVLLKESTDSISCLHRKLCKSIQY